MPASWDAYFLNDAKGLDEGFCRPEDFEGGLSVSSQNQDETIRIQMMILAYRNYGHIKAKIDPLNLDRKLYQQKHLIERFELALDRL